MKKYNWVLTDDDCCQYVRRAYEIDPHCYECVQLIEYPVELADALGNEYGISHTFINLDDYSQEEMLDILRGYYSNLESCFISESIKAECVFESIALDSIERDALNRHEAEKVVQDIIVADLMVNKEG